MNEINYYINAPRNYLTCLMVDCPKASDGYIERLNW